MRGNDQYPLLWVPPLTPRISSVDLGEGSRNPHRLWYKHQDEPHWIIAACEAVMGSNSRSIRFSRNLRSRGLRNRFFRRSTRSNLGLDYPPVPPTIHVSVSPFFLLSPETWNRFLPCPCVLLLCVVCDVSRCQSVKSMEVYLLIGRVSTSGGHSNSDKDTIIAISKYCPSIVQQGNVRVALA
jgi:hypothetical protein